MIKDLRSFIVYGYAIASVVIYYNFLLQRPAPNISILQPQISDYVIAD